MEREARSYCQCIASVIEWNEVGRLAIIDFMIGRDSIAVPVLHQAKMCSASNRSDPLQRQEPLLPVLCNLSIAVLAHSKGQVQRPSNDQVAVET